MIAKSDGMKNILITSKTGELLYDSALLAGAESTAKTKDEDYNDEEGGETKPETESKSEEEPEANEVDPNDIYDDVDPIQLDSSAEAPVPKHESEENEEKSRRNKRKNLHSDDQQEHQLHQRDWNLR